jgi:hypothetical protein
LVDIAQELARVFRKTQHGFARPDCRLAEGLWLEFAMLVVEWAEDIHNDLGLWRAVEAHQEKVFGTPLPQLVDVSTDSRPEGFDPRRLQYLLWQLWACEDPAYDLPLTHPDFRGLADAGASFLKERFLRVPRDSGIKHLLSAPTTYAWDLKRKLVWLGTQSYLFRGWTLRHVAKAPPGGERELTDRLLLSHCSRWSGLGPVEVLASIVDLPATDREALLSWRNPHVGFYRPESRPVYETGRAVLKARNVVTGQPYTISYLPDPRVPEFTPDYLIFGTLVPWRGEWAWSGIQRVHQGVNAAQEAQLRERLLDEAADLAYRYTPEETNVAFRFLRREHERFVAYYGTDLKVFPDGETAAAAEQARINSLRASTAEESAAAEASLGLGPQPLELEFSPLFLYNKHGLAAFSEPEEGISYTRDFNHLISGLAKGGNNLATEELHAVRGLVVAEELSPGLVRRLVREHGAAAILKAFHLEEAPQELALEFLFRRYKGKFYRPRPPSIILRPVKPAPAVAAASSL